MPTKSLDWNSVEHDCHGRNSGAEASERLTGLQRGNVLDAPIELLQLGEGGREPLAGLHHDTFKEAGSASVPKKLRWNRPTHSAAVPIPVNYTHEGIVFLAGF